MNLPPKPSDDEDAPLIRSAKPTTSAINTTTGVKSAPGDSGLSGTPNRGSSAQNAPSISGQGLFSGGPAKPSTPTKSNGLSTSSPGVTARNPGGIGSGIGSGENTQRSPQTTSGFAFGNNQQKSASGTSWGVTSPKPTPAAPSPKPATKSGWGWGGISSLVNKAQNALETFTDENHASPVEKSKPAPLPTPAPSSSQQAAAPKPTTSKSSIDEKIAAIRAKRAALKTADEATKAPPKNTLDDAPTKPIVDLQVPSTSSPIVAAVQIPETPKLQFNGAPAPVSKDTADTLGLDAPAPTSANKPGPDPSMAQIDNKVTSAMEAQVANSSNINASLSTADTAKDGENSNLPASEPLNSPNYPRAPSSTVSSKTAGSGLRLNTRSVSDGKESAHTEQFATKRNSVGSEDKTPLSGVRPSLVDMRASSSSSSRPGGFGFGGAGIGSNFPARGFGGASRIGLGNFGATRMFGQQPSPVATPLGEPEKLELNSRTQQRDDDLSSIVEGSVQDVDSLVGENVDEELPQIDSARIADIPIQIDTLDTPIHLDTPTHLVHPTPSADSIPPVDPLPRAEPAPIVDLAPPAPTMAPSSDAPEIKPDVAEATGDVLETANADRESIGSPTVGDGSTIGGGGTIRDDVTSKGEAIINDDAIGKEDPAEQDDAIGKDAKEEDAAVAEPANEPTPTPAPEVSEPPVIPALVQDVEPSLLLEETKVPESSPEANAPIVDAVPPESNEKTDARGKKSDDLKLSIELPKPEDSSSKLKSPMPPTPGDKKKKKKKAKKGADTAAAEPMPTTPSVFEPASSVFESASSVFGPASTMAGLIPSMVGLTPSAEEVAQASVEFTAAEPAAAELPTAGEPEPAPTFAEPTPVAVEAAPETTEPTSAMELVVAQIEHASETVPQPVVAEASVEEPLAVETKVGNVLMSSYAMLIFP